MASDSKTPIPNASLISLGMRNDKQRGLQIGRPNAGTPVSQPMPRAELQATARSAPAPVFQVTPVPPFDPGRLEAMLQDPYLAPRLDAIRDHTQKQFLSLIDETVADLPKGAVGPSTVALGSPAVSGRRLMIDSRRGEMAGKSRRDLAEAMALEAVLNLGNPNWDPARPETSKETPNLLLTLLRDK